MVWGRSLLRDRTPLSNCCYVWTWFNRPSHQCFFWLCNCASFFQRSLFNGLFGGGSILISMIQTPRWVSYQINTTKMRLMSAIISAKNSHVQTQVVPFAADSGGKTKLNLDFPSKLLTILVLSDMKADPICYHWWLSVITWYLINNILAVSHTLGVFFTL